MLHLLLLTFNVLRYNDSSFPNNSDCMDIKTLCDLLKIEKNNLFSLEKVKFSNVF